MSSTAVLVLLAVTGACDSREVVEVVEPTVPLSLTLTPDSALLTYIGESETFTARVTGDPAGTLTWHTSDSAVFTVEGAGAVTARGNGTGLLRVRIGNLSDTAPIRVRQAVDSLEVIGAGQRALAGWVLSDPVGVVLLDAGGTEVADTVVNFHVAAGGGRVSPEVVRTDSVGAAFAIWTLGDVTGPQTMEVSVSDAQRTEIVATALTADEAVEGMELVSGVDQRAAAGLRLPEPVTVVVADPHGRPVPGATVRFSADTASGRVEPDEVLSDSVGTASAGWTLGSAPGNQRLVVSVADRVRVEVGAVALAPDSAVQAISVLSGEGQRALAGRALPQPVVVRVADDAGRPIADAAVRFQTASGGGRAEPTVAQSDTAGVAATSWTLGASVGSQALLVSAGPDASAQVLATALTPEEAAEAIELLSGGGQRAMVGRRLREAVAVRVVDGVGVPITGAVVGFRIRSGGGTVHPAESTSDSLGLASATWTLGSRVGEQHLAASIGERVRLSIGATALPPDSVVEVLELQAGLDQWAVAGHPLPEQVVVRALDADSVPVPGARVRFVPRSGSGHVVPGTAATDSAGLASTLWVLGPAPGEDSLNISVARGLRLDLAATAVSDEGACPRTPAVSAELVRLIQKRAASSGGASPASCAEVTERQLATVYSLILDHSGIGMLGVGDFEGLTGLRQLWLNGNRLRTLPQGIFADLRNIDEILLGFNRIESLPPGVFSGLPTLRRLFLWGNRLSDLPTGIFDGLTGLETLRIGTNEFADLPPDVFRGIPALRDLGLARNRLQGLPPGLFAGLGELRRLFIQENEISTLSAGIFSNLSNLRFLSMDDNQLSALSPGVFQDLTDLESLHLRENRLTGLPDGIFAGLANLDVLDLRYNGLEQVQPTLFGGLASLRDLRLAGNGLTDLPRSVFAGLRSLETVNLLGNPGAPFPLALELVRRDADNLVAPGPADVVLRIPVGAPFALRTPVTVQRGTGSLHDLSLSAGDTASAIVAVRRQSGSAGPTYVSLGPLPKPPTAYRGLEVVGGEQMLLFAESDNKTPVRRAYIPPHRLQQGGPAAEIRLTSHFVDPDGDSLRYETVTSDARIASASTEDGVLSIEPGSEGAAVVEVAALDPSGLRAVQRISVSVGPAPDPGGFNIELVFMDPFPAWQEAEIRRAAMRWMHIVTNDLPDVPINGHLYELSYYAGECAEPPGPRRVGSIDDVLIRVFRLPPDQQFYLALAAQCGVREGSELAFYGFTSYSSYYFGDEPGESSLYDTALHEIAHVLGFGTGKWDDMLRNPATDERGADAHFPGPLAVRAFDAAGGRTYTGGKVPVQNTGGPGTMDSHWRRSVLAGEIMGPNPSGGRLSRITLQALADLGYEVDLSKADLYSLPPRGQAEARGEERSVTTDKVLRVPVVVVDSDGNVIRVIRR